MAGPFNCDHCQEEPAQFMVTNVENGDTMTYGVACFARFGLTFATMTLLRDEIDKVLEASPFTTTEVTEEPAPDGVEPKSETGPAPEPAPQPVEPAGEPTVAPAPADG